MRVCYCSDWAQLGDFIIPNEREIREERERGAPGAETGHVCYPQSTVGNTRGQQVILDNSVLIVTFMTEAQCGIKTEKQTTNCKLK